MGKNMMRPSIKPTTSHYFHALITKLPHKACNQMIKKVVLTCFADHMNNSKINVQLLS
jgi:hypothetical protein